MNRSRRPADQKAVGAALAWHFDRIPTTLVISTGAIILAAAIALSRTPLPAVHTTVSVTVSAGQSLWSIAREHPVPGLTTAQTVELITRINALRASTIAPGDTLHVPLGSPEDGGVAMR